MIPFKSKLRGIENIEERNTVYKKLSQEDAVKEIGYDILTNYTARLIKPQSLSQYWPVEVSAKLNHVVDPVVFQQKVIENKEKILCSVCARGAIMTSRIELGDSICGINNFSSGSGESGEDSLIEEFDIEDLLQMEDLYEDSGFLRYYNRTPECIAAIAANLVANGRFISSDIKDYLKLWDIKILYPESIRVIVPEEL